MDTHRTDFVHPNETWQYKREIVLVRLLKLIKSFRDTKELQKFPCMAHTASVQKICDLSTCGTPFSLCER